MLVVGPVWGLTGDPHKEVVLDTLGIFLPRFLASPEREVQKPEESFECRPQRPGTEAGDRWQCRITNHGELPLSPISNPNSASV